MNRADSGMGLSGSTKSMESFAMKRAQEIEKKLLTFLIAIIREVAMDPEQVNQYGAVLEYICSLCATLCIDADFSSESWAPCVVPYLVSSGLTEEEESQVVCDQFRTQAEDEIEKERLAKLGGIDEEMGEEVCNINFSLAYGGKVLLHNTQLLLHRGRKYGLLGHNGVGKTTLLRNIDNGKIEGLPEELVSVFVQSHFDDDMDEIPVLEYVLSDPLIKDKLEPSVVEDMMRSLNFTDEMLSGPTSALSGGWRMKLALARCLLIDPDIMLLDEPTNHLDANTIKWLIKHLQDESHATVLVVSHDTAFLDAVCTDVIHYETQKLVRYPGNLSTFVKKKPECRSYYELASTGGLVFKFPNPGRLDGINSTTRAILRVENVDYTYPGSDVPTLENVNCQLCLGSRVCVLGANGAGKTTLVRLIVGETKPTNPEGQVWKHHNLRISYVAQHSFYHVEQHLDKSPVEYIQWRFKNAEDQESLAKETMQLDEAAAAKLGQKYGQVERLTGQRHLKGGKLEYEVAFVGMREKDNKYLDRETLETMGFGSLCRQVDEKVAAEAAGIPLRSTGTLEVQSHLDDFNLEQEFGTYGRIKGLSGGQKVKLVLAAAFWMHPHLLVLDEPTNYLDREALGALAEAIRNYGGGVMMISHSEEFYGALCTETWNVGGGRVEVEGQAASSDLKVTRKKTEKEQLMEKAEETKAAVACVGNTNTVQERTMLINEKTGRPLSKKEIRALAKKNTKKK